MRAGKEYTFIATPELAVTLAYLGAADGEPLHHPGQRRPAQRQVLVWLAQGGSARGVQTGGGLNRTS